MRTRARCGKDTFMKPYIILADVTCDLSPELRERFGVRDYVHGYVHFSDGRDLRTALDWSLISRDEFYTALSNKKLKLTTAPASPEEYYEYFCKWARQGYDILSISLSSRISSTFDVAAGAAARVRAEFPDCEIYTLDSLRMSGALGLLVLYAHELQASGKTMQEVIDWLESHKRCVHQMGPIDDLMYIARRGRISTGKAIMGSFAGVKPMGDCNADGYVTVLTKAKGLKKALPLTVSYVQLAARDIENSYVLIAHSNRAEFAEALRERLINELHPREVLVTEVHSSNGPNIGPGMIGAYFLGDPLSEDGSAEKDMMAKAIAQCE